ncbi:hypothetical protein [Sphaerisporangium dianthi]|uniref:DUF4239 domain-containing protein n=1 Tax=Sphaerisporangium dianthi TaxID=1436120 RepID=A0ABV9CUH7_9ACTN
MIAGFWSGLSGRLADRTAAAVFSPAFAFWVAGLLAWYVSDPGRLAASAAEAARLPEVTLLGAVVLLLMVVAASGVLAEQLAPAALRLLQGHWPRPLTPLAGRLARRHRERQERLEERWQELYARVAAEAASPGDEDELLDVEQRLAAMPARPDLLLPTRLGNLLRAAETGVHDKYGMDAVRCWPALWLLLPEFTRTEVAGARKTLDAVAVWWIWSALLAVWTALTPWALPVAAVAAALSYAALLGAAARYGELVDAAFALHRGLLYEAVGRPVPGSPDAEVSCGKALTAALWRGPAGAGPPHAPPP